jgi:hypothetical protein
VGRRDTRAGTTAPATRGQPATHLEGRPWPLRLTLLLAFAMAACTDRPLTTVALSLNGTPLQNVEITAFPFDPGRILDSLADAAPTPAPDFSALTAELRAFDPDSVPPPQPADPAWAALRDSVVALSDMLGRMDRRSAGYATHYERFRGLYARYAQATARHETAARAAGGSLLDLARRARAAADSLRAWEHVAYAGFETVIARELGAQDRVVQSATTDSAGRAALRLPPGAWWIVARTPPARNPFFEHYWSVEVHPNPWLPTVVRLTERTAVEQWRH